MNAVTIFAHPKKSIGHFRLIQRNALRSWTAMRPRPEIILLGSDAGTEEAAQEFGAIHVPEVERNAEGTPVLSDIFRQAEKRASHRIRVYVNADIVLPPFFANRLGTVSFRRFLAIGQRWDLDVTEPLDVEAPGWWPHCFDDARQRGVLHPAVGIDYFAYTKGLWGDIPPFALGRTAWDNWLVFRAAAQGAAVIDATAVLPVIHQNHDYSHVVGGEAVASAGPEATRNRELYAKHAIPDIYFGVADATWVWSDAGFSRATDAERQERLVHVRRAQHPTRYRIRRLLHRAVAVTLGKTT